MHRKVPAWFGGGERGKGASTWEDTSPRSLSCHLSYVREGTGHALIGFRQWIPREHVKDPVRSLRTGLPLDLRFRTKGELAIEICQEIAAGGVTPDFTCGDEVYGACTKLREHLEQEEQAYVLRVPKNFRFTMRGGTVLTCEEAVKKLLKSPRRWEVRSAGKGSKGSRWYAWAWIGTASGTHSVLVRRHLKTGELAFHYCYVPEGQPCSKTRLIRAAGLRWPVEEGFEFGKDQFGLDESQVRIYTAIARRLLGEDVPFTNISDDGLLGRLKRLVIGS